MMSGTKHFVFVPGSFHAAWCWDKMQGLLNINGNTSVAIDLPAHGSDKTLPKDVNLDSYVDAVCKVVEQYDEPVVLVGHSRAGIIISQVAESIPGKIEQLVYLCAYLIPNGEPMVATALSDTGSVLGPNLIFNEEEAWHFPKNEIVRGAFYADCSEEDIERALKLLSKEPNVPVVTPLHLSDERYGSVKKVYIKTSEDRTISPQLQESMLKRLPVNKVFEMDASHSPFLSKPGELADILLNKL